MGYIILVVLYGHLTCIERPGTARTLRAGIGLEVIHLIAKHQVSSSSRFWSFAEGVFSQFT
jgi:hypothetical protein